MVLNMASFIILHHGESGHLVPKPANYATLINVARAKFSKLYEVDNDSITFNFTPEWYDGEVELDRDAFAAVHNRAVLRITTTTVAPAQHPGNDGIIQTGGVANQGAGCLVLEGRMSLYVVHGKCTMNPRYSHARAWYCLWHILMAAVPTDERIWFVMKPQTRLLKLMDRAATTLGISRDDYRFYHKGRVLENNDTPKSMGIAHEDIIEMFDDY